MLANRGPRQTMAASAVRRLIVDSCLLTAAIVVAAGLSMAACRWLGRACDWTSVACATLAVVAAFIPPLWIDAYLGPSVGGTLATMAWRLGILLPAVLWSTVQIEAARNCVQVTMLACYLMILPLESWLLIRQSRP